MRTGTRAIAAAAAAGIVVAASPSAHAATYRYWTYWQAPAGAWSFASAGPATTLPADGSVEGWRFALTTAAGTAQDAPRASASFDALCGATPGVAGKKRIGLVIDFGDAAIAPEGETAPAQIATCVVADPDATGYQVLRSVAEVRTDDVGLVCGLAGYPARACAEPFDGPAAAASGPTAAAGEPAADPSDDGGSPAGTVLAIAAIAALGAGAVLIARRRRT